MSVKAKSDVDKVFFPEPVVEQYKSTKVKEVRTVVDTISQKKQGLAQVIHNALIEARANGFNEGAVVAPKYATRSAVMVAGNWGIVTRLSKWANNVADYKPLFVQWVNHNKLDSYHNVEDLYLINEAPMESSLTVMLDIQDEYAEKEIQC